MSGHLDRWVDAAAAAFPNVPAGEIRLLAAGRMSIAVQVGDDIVARFPRHAFGLECLRYEVRVLPLLRSSVVTIPRPTRAHLDAPIGEAFLAHRLIPGTVLTPHSIGNLPPATVRALGAVLGRFLSELHALTDDAGRMGVPTLSLADHAAGLRREMMSLLWDRMTAGARERADRELTAMAQADRGLLLLCHTDLGGNVIYDANSGEVGVIDFAGLVVCDPVTDLASLLSLDRGLAAAMTDTCPRLQDRLEDGLAVMGTFAVQDALYSARQGDWDAVMKTLAGYSPPPK